MDVPSSTCGGVLCNAGIWGGLGGFNDTSNGGLIQSGFWLQGSGNYCPQTSCGMTQRSPVLFVEYIPGDVLIVPWESLNYSQTDTIYALGWSCDAQLNMTNTGAYACFWFENATTQILSGIGVVPKPTNPTTVFNGKTAEFIVEKPNNRNLGNFIYETMVGTSWELNGTAHTNATDDWAVFDLTNSNGIVVKSFFPQNGGIAGPDLPPQPDIAFAWFSAR
jgi:hypothetical protein